MLDADSVRTRKMMKEYDEIQVPGFNSRDPVFSRQLTANDYAGEVFYNNSWYIRK